MLTTEINFKFVDGMTAKSLLDISCYALIEYFKDSEKYRTVEAFKEEFDISITGGWVIKKETLDAINDVNMECGGDSDTYELSTAKKNAVRKYAVFTIEL